MMNETRTETVYANGSKYTRVTSYSWGELQDIERDYKKNGFKTSLDFGNIKDSTFKLTIKMDGDKNEII